MVTDLNYHCVYVHFCMFLHVLLSGNLHLLDYVCDDVTGAFQGASEGGKDGVEGLLFSHTWLGDG